MDTRDRAKQAAENFGHLGAMNTEAKITVALFTHNGMMGNTLVQYTEEEFEAWHGDHMSKGAVEEDNGKTLILTRPDLASCWAVYPKKRPW